jgi:hypothetical protein
LSCIFRFGLHIPKNMHTILKAFVCFSKVAKLFGEGEYINDCLIFMKANYKLLEARNVFSDSGTGRLTKFISPQKYK